MHGIGRLGEPRRNHRTFGIEFITCGLSDLNGLLGCGSRLFPFCLRISLADQMAPVHFADEICIVFAVSVEERGSGIEPQP